MLGIVSLNQHLTRAIGAARAAGDLQDRLREALVSARVGTEQPLVRVQHADQRDARKVVPLREHLRADQDVVSRRAQRRRARPRASLCGSWRRDRAARRARSERAPPARRPRAACRRRPDALAAAMRARPDELALRAAVMAASLPRFRVHREPRVAPRALLGALAARTEQRRREAAAIEEQQHLVAGSRDAGRSRATSGVESDCRLACRERSTTLISGSPAAPMRRGISSLR